MKSGNVKRQRAQDGLEPSPLTVIPSRRYDALGLTSADLNFEQWRELGGQFGHAMRCVQFAIGDWLLYAETHGIEKNYWNVQRGQVSSKVYAEAVALTGIDRATLQNYTYVARNVLRRSRNACVSWEHHRKVAKLKDCREQSKWLALVEDGQKSGDRVCARRWALSMVCDRLVSRTEMEASDGNRGIENVHPYVNRIVAFVAKLRATGWMKDAGGHKLRSLARDLLPVADLANELNTLADEADGESQRKAKVATRPGTLHYPFPPRP